MDVLRKEMRRLANRLPNLNVIFAGTTLFIPGCGTGKPYPDITPVYPPDGKPGYPGGGKPGYPGGPGGYGGNGCEQYVVKPGETLSHIAMYTGDSVMAIAQRNKLINPNLVYAGQVLIVCHGGIGHPPIGYPPIGKPPIGQPSDPGYPPTKPGYGCRDVHIVKPYETLYHIALMYGSNVYAIAARNNIANPNLVFAGQPICIP
jgi:LysM repeat protein